MRGQQKQGASDIQFPRLMCKCHCNSVLIGLRRQDLTCWTQETHRLAYGTQTGRLIVERTHTHTHTNVQGCLYSNSANLTVGLSFFGIAFAVYRCGKDEPYMDEEAYKQQQPHARTHKCIQRHPPTQTESSMNIQHCRSVSCPQACSSVTTKSKHGLIDSRQGGQQGNKHVQINQTLQCWRQQQF